jgi:hypothetical protein
MLRSFPRNFALIYYSNIIWKKQKAKPLHVLLQRMNTKQSNEKFRIDMHVYKRNERDEYLKFRRRDSM